MSTPARSYLVELGLKSAWIHVPGQILMPAIRAAHSPRKRDEARRCWTVPAAHVDDVLAALTRQSGVDLNVVRVDR
jgi:hypothetical protein